MKKFVARQFSGRYPRIACLLGCIGLLLLIGGCKKRSIQTYRFFVAGHVYGSPQRKAPGLHPPFVKDFDYLRQQPQMRFGVFTGDIVYYSRDTFWDAVDRQVEDLGWPVHFAAGNHDEGHRSPYKERYGRTYYSFEQEGDLFLVLNPGLNGWNIRGEQLAFLKKQLARAGKYHNIFLFFHHLLWWSPDNKYQPWPPNSLDGRAPEINFWPEVIPLLRQTGRPVYCFAGDLGANSQRSPFFADREGPVHFIASGMGNLREDNYLVVEVARDKKVQVKVRWIQKDLVQPINWESISIDP